ncbi:uncharacterized protein LOC120151464 [Hibiscus syriacus]|uniref:uncharacterized protein LOC120151464 n=1 Tax=Hibiscus syriacus TaxID=106335 RepID=UPI00192462B3|nr:uncharacterized protein LOC120151464 [Hibiscus syriacus]
MRGRIVPAKFMEPKQSILEKKIEDPLFSKLESNRRGVSLGKVTRERGKSLSLSPKSRETVSKVIAPKPAATTVGTKRSMKKEEDALSTIQPKRLFKDAEKPVTAKRPLKPGRVVSSRYNQIPSQSNNRRFSNEQMVGSRNRESGVKNKWEIPS